MSKGLGFQSWLCHFLVMWLWASDLTFLILSFPGHKMGVTTVLGSWGYCEATYLTDTKHLTHINYYYYIWKIIDKSSIDFLRWTCKDCPRKIPNDIWVESKLALKCVDLGLFKTNKERPRESEWDTNHDWDGLKPHPVYVSHRLQVVELLRATRFKKSECLLEGWQEWCLEQALSHGRPSVDG